MTDLEVELDWWVKLYESHCKHDYSPSTVKRLEAKIEVIRNDPRDVNKLNVLIALKEKEFVNCKEYPQRDILEARCDALKHVRQAILARESGAHVGTTMP